MKKYLLAVVVTSVALGAFACGSSGDPQAPGGATEKVQTGTLSVALIGTDNQGTQYRLRNATFQITAYSYCPYPYPCYPGGAGGVGGATSADGGVFVDPGVTTVSSETNPDDPTIIVPLTPGSYTVALVNDDWYLEKLTPTGPQVISPSILLSDRYQYAYIYDRGVSDVIFQFGAGGQLIDFRRGDLHIGIQVELPSVCGNGTVEGTEQCDGANLNGQTCETLTFGSEVGTLACNSACGYDLSGCIFNGGSGGAGTGGGPAFDGGAASGGTASTGGATSAGGAADTGGATSAGGAAAGGGAAGNGHGKP